MQNTQNHVMPHQCGMRWQCSFFKVRQQEQRTSTVSSLHGTQSQHPATASGVLHASCHWLRKVARIF